MPEQIIPLSTFQMNRTIKFVGADLRAASATKLSKAVSEGPRPGVEVWHTHNHTAVMHWLWSLPPGDLARAGTTGTAR